MKAIKFFTLLLTFGLIVSGVKAHDFSNQSHRKDFKTWKITSFVNGGFAGILKSYTLDSDGVLTHRDREKESKDKISEKDTREISQLLNQLNLPSAKLKMAKGRRIYDGVYSLFAITLDGKEYKIDGSFFSDTKIASLTSKQRKTLGKLKNKLEILGVENLSK